MIVCHHISPIEILEYFSYKPELQDKDDYGMVTLKKRPEGLIENIEFKDKVFPMSQINNLTEISQKNRLGFDENKELEQLYYDAFESNMELINNIEIPSEIEIAGTTYQNPMPYGDYLQLQFKCKENGVSTFGRK